MTFRNYNNNVVIMIPNFIALNGALWKVLPPGVHIASLQAIKQRFAYNRLRVQLYGGLQQACANLATAGCRSLYLDGSFVTEKPEPGDFDACWDPVGVNQRRLDPVFRDFSNLRAKQKQKFGGEFFPSTTQADGQGRTFIDFFQVEKFTGQLKGIIKIDLVDDPMSKPQVPP